jgi:hypothetical protein
MRCRMILATALLALAGLSPVHAATPAEDEVRTAAAPAPDYGDVRNWAAGPGGNGAAAALPDGASAIPDAAAADVFYVHPTTFRTDTLWNQDTGDAAANRWVDDSAVARQGGAFSGCCRVFAPRYRAASYKALSDGAHRDAAFALAYGDVERAFDWYLAHENKGRPFIIAGHSQGAAHIAMLLEKRIDGTALQQRMVAAYIIGINLSQGEFGLRFRHVGVCRQPAQTGCVLQWNAIAAGSNLGPIVAAYEKTFTDKYGAAPGKDIVCINPVTFDAGRPASVSAEAKGAVPGDPGFGGLRPLRAGQVAVRCERGMAVTYLAPGLDLKVLPGGSMHYHDIGLFYGDVRANALLRTRSWLAAHRRGRRQ